MTDIGSCFNPKNHPDVKSGKTPVATLLSDFFETFTTVSTSGYVTLDQFLEYYANAAFYEEDSEFEEMMASVWILDQRPEASNSASMSASGSGRTLQDFAKTKSQTEASNQGVPSFPALEELRSQLAARGASGIVGLGRKFRIMDDDNSKNISFPEFKKAFAEMKLQLAESEIRLLFDS